MNIDSFLSHHQLSANPFAAEEARHDKIFEQMLGASPVHPDFGKVLGRIDRPSTSVVFGEKGSGKTAIRLLIGQRVAQHNADNPKARTLMVAYDDLNPVLDRVVQRSRDKQGFFGSSDDVDELLKAVRLEDHQDAILSLAVTKLVDSILGQGQGDEAMPRPDKPIRDLPRRDRVDLAVLAALYDQPRSGLATDRYRKLLKHLKLGLQLPSKAIRNPAILLLVAAAVAYGVYYGWHLLDWALHAVDVAPAWIWWLSTVLLVLGAGMFAAYLFVYTRLWRLSKRLTREMPAVDRRPAELIEMLDQLRGSDRQGQPWPTSGIGSREARYRLTARLLDILRPMGYVGMMVLIDRVDEPTLVTGKASRMKAVIWPMFDNKFLQQNGLGMKMLLPIELRHELFRESSNFFQEARLDKQNLVDRLTWSGAVLYDLASRRLQTCRQSEDGATVLTDLFEPEVDKDMLIDALDQMDQPRDAFKFLYGVLQEHCKMVPDDSQQYRIPRLVLDAVRRQQAQRVQELYRGVSPA